MSSATFIDLRINNAEQFVESVSEPDANSKLYLTYGKTDSWANDLSPNVANTSVATVYEVWENMIGAKRILGGDIRHVIPRINWTSNTRYFAYNHREPNLYDQQFYVMNSDYSVYKCLSNNRGGFSTSEPTAINPSSTTETADGYKWKYMYTLNDMEKLKYVSDNYIPVRTLRADDGSLQWQVQEAAVPGTVENIIILDEGQFYSNANTVYVTFSGDGSGLTGNVSLNTTSNTVQAITITNPGSDYTYASVTITDTGTGTGALAMAVISPPGGHGRDPLYELGGKDVFINCRLRYDEDGVFPVTNDYRQISIIKDPYEFDTTTTATELAVLQATTLTCDGAGDFAEDEMVYQGSNLTTATFKARVVSWDSDTSKLIVINIIGSPTVSQSIIGATSFTARVITSTLDGALEPYSGRLIYTDNILPVTRSSDQIEEYKILLRF